MNSKASEYGLDFQLFIILQSTIVCMTFFVDVYLFDRPLSLFNVVGAVLTVACAAAAVFFY